MIKIEKLGGQGDTLGPLPIFDNRFYSVGKWLVGPWLALVAMAPLFQWGFNRFTVMAFIALAISGGGLIFYLMYGEKRVAHILKRQRTAFVGLAIPLFIVSNLYLLMPEVTRMLEPYFIVTLGFDDAKASEWIRGFKWLWVVFLTITTFAAVVQFINMRNMLKAREEIGSFNCSFGDSEDGQRIVNIKFDDTREVRAKGFTYINFYTQKLLLMAFGLALFILQSIAAVMGDVNVFLFACIATITQQELFKNALVVELNGALYRELSIHRTILTDLIYNTEPDDDDGECVDELVK